MRFGHLELEVRVPLLSLAWYTERLGCRLVSNQADRYVWVERGGVEILLKPGTPGQGHSVVFYSKEPETEASRLLDRGVNVDRRGNAWHFSDPDGNPFQLVDPSADHSG
jgi:catechol 2,3-dioxygenase-like lactoylglutathione lyase family enzyme